MVPFKTSVESNASSLEKRAVIHFVVSPMRIGYLLPSATSNHLMLNNVHESLPLDIVRDQKHREKNC